MGSELLLLLELLFLSAGLMTVGGIFFGLIGSGNFFFSSSELLLLLLEDELFFFGAGSSFLGLTTMTDLFLSESLDDEDDDDLSRGFLIMGF